VDQEKALALLRLKGNPREREINTAFEALAGELNEKINSALDEASKDECRKRLGEVQEAYDVLMRDKIPLSTPTIASAMEPSKDTKAQPEPTSDLAKDIVSCSAGCGSHLHWDTIRCPSCGALQTRARYRDRRVAALLAFFLGGLGVHRYYLGLPYGLHYLSWIWTFVPIAKAIKEGIAISRFDQAKWDEKFNQGRVSQQGRSDGVGETLVIVVLGLIVYALLTVWLLFLIAVTIFFLDQS
jgi:TM2 domain-containing membrane protein YozV|tara:strand:+ start:1155 stop:1877 length:723 start_codon:yes stop_codon:yes gene_type:complete